MLSITFKFRDYLSDERWITRHCEVESIEECIKIYGLDENDVGYEIIEIKEI